MWPGGQIKKQPLRHSFKYSGSKREGETNRQQQEPPGARLAACPSNDKVLKPALADQSGAHQCSAEFAPRAAACRRPEVRPRGAPPCSFTCKCQAFIEAASTAPGPPGPFQASAAAPLPAAAGGGGCTQRHPSRAWSCRHLASSAACCRTPRAPEGAAGRGKRAGSRPLVRGSRERSVVARLLDKLHRPATTCTNVRRPPWRAGFGLARALGPHAQGRTPQGLSRVCLAPYRLFGSPQQPGTCKRTPLGRKKPRGHKPGPLQRCNMRS